MEVYLVFTDTKTALSKMIKTYTGHSYSHVSISFDRELTAMYSFGRKNPDNAFRGGFVKEDSRSPLFQRACCAVYRCRVSRESRRRMREYVGEMERRQEELKYNLTGLFGVVMNRNFIRKDTYFCSQFVADVLRQGDVVLSDKPPALTLPQDLADAERLDLVYRGPLNAYPYMFCEVDIMEFVEVY